MSRDTGDPTRSQRRTVLNRDGDRCLRCGRFNRGHLHIHHRKLRSRGGTNQFANLVALCSVCHHWVHTYPMEATEVGLMLASWADVTGAGIDGWRGRTWLDDDGGMRVEPRSGFMGVLRKSEPPAEPPPAPA